MRKDFSDTAKETLKRLIQDIENEQWSSFTDELGDLLFLYNWDIADYVGDVDRYWKHTLDNENSTAADIDRIFAAADAVDAEHGVALQAQIDAVNAQIEYVRSISAAFSTPGGLSPDGIQVIRGKAEAVASAMVAAFIETLRDTVGTDADGNPIYRYEHGYVRNLMQLDPDNLSYEQYLALIAIFEEMGIADKELFIEESYIEVPMVSSIPGLGEAIIYHWEISPVFERMASISRDELLKTEFTLDDLSDPNEPDFLRINNKVFACSLLMSIVQYGHDYTVPTSSRNPSYLIDRAEVNIEIREAFVEGIDRLPYDYSITGNGGFSFDLYQYRKDLDFLLDKAVVASNIGRLTPSLGELVSENAVAVTGAVTGLAPEIGAAAGVFFVGVGIGMSIHGYYANKQIADYTYGALDAGNAARALFMGATVSVSPNGGVTSYSLNLAVFNTDDLAIAFKIYEENTGRILTVDALVTGTASQDDVDAYISWYASSGSSLVWSALQGSGEDQP
jgi:hypothetical protein